MSFDFSKIYRMGDQGRRGELVVRYDEDIDAMAVFLGKQQLSTPLVCTWHMGRTPYDLIPTGDPMLILISQRVVDVWQKHGFTGWTTFPVEVWNKKQKLEGYYGLVITGRCGPIDRSRSEIVWRDPVVPGGEGHYYRRGWLFDPETWDGSDLFCPEKSGAIFVTQRVKEATEQARLTNIMFKPITEMESMVLPGDPDYREGPPPGR